MKKGIVLLLLLSACGARIKQSTLIRYPSKPKGSEIVVYMTKKPPCDYEELAILSVNRDPARVIPRLKRVARDVGGDGLLFDGGSESSHTAMQYNFFTGVYEPTEVHTAKYQVVVTRCVGSES